MADDTTFEHERPPVLLVIVRLTRQPQAWRRSSPRQIARAIAK